MELSRPRVGLRVAFTVALALLLTASAATAATAAASTGAAPTGSDTPVQVSDLFQAPAGYHLTPIQAQRIAAADPRVRGELLRHPTATPYEYTKGPGRWQVSWFSRGTKPKELLEVYVDDLSAKVTEVWTGFQVQWTMARGYPGAFGRHVNAWYVWTALCLLFAAPFIPWRRRPTLLHLDLAVLLAFSVSLAFFNHARIGLSVPLVYPPLGYLLVRMVLLGFGRGRPRHPLRLTIPVSWLAILIVFLVGFRVGLDLSDSNVIDVGYAGVIGADKLLHNQPLYGGWPRDNANGDTYGPVNYYAYVPFRAVLGWSGTWDNLPAGHGAAIFFDLLTLLCLFLLGRRVRGPTTGVVLAYAWASYPFTLFALASNSNDSLVALLVVLGLLVIRSAPARGIAAALAGLTKFAPLVLAPLMLRGVDQRLRPRRVAVYLLSFTLTVVVTMAPVLTGGDLHAFWRDTVSYQLNRGSPFSVWGLWGGLGPVQHLVQGAALALAMAVAFVPRRRGLPEVAALGAAVLIALQMGITHWFYLYIPWFFPLVITALVCTHPPLDGEDRDTADVEPRAPARVAAAVS